MQSTVPVPVLYGTGTIPYTKQQTVVFKLNEKHKVMAENSIEYSQSIYKNNCYCKVVLIMVISQDIYMQSTVQSPYTKYQSTNCELNEFKERSPQK